jgi:L-arabinose transport system permease protein
MQMVRGLTYIVSDGRSIIVNNESFSALGNWTFQDMSLPVWIMLTCFVAFGLLLNRTTFGRNALAIGGNKEAAHLAGIAVARTKMIIFAMQGMAAALAGVVLAALMRSGQPMVAQGLELQVISGCVLGGVSLSGGVGSILGVIVGVLIMGVVQNVMNLMNIQPFYQLLVSGAILLAAVTFDRLKQLHRR